jgi:POT family proton-dependent oligopeptide transporter
MPMLSLLFAADAPAKTLDWAAMKPMAIAWPIVIAWIIFVIATNIKTHPKALFALFLVELWERFSYYGMRAFLILFLTAELVNGGFGVPESEAYGIYGAYGALVYLTPILGGFLADRYLGFRNAIIWGALLMAAGQFTLAASGESQTLLFAGLSLLVIGNGFFKPNISSMIGKFYQQGDPRRDGAFTIFYMGINIGAFLAPLTCGTLAEKVDWKWGFISAGCGMILGLLIFLWTWKQGLLEDKADPPTDPASQKFLSLPAYPAIILLTFLLVPVASLLIKKNDAMDVLLGVVGVGMIGFMVYLSSTYEKVERQRIWVIIALLFFTTVFWTFFELAGSALNIFTKKNVDKTLLGMELETSNFQSLNALFIMIFAPIFSAMWIWMGRRNIEPSAPLKFSAALALLGAGFLILNLGVPVSTAGMMPALFLALLYLLHTLGELALSPVGLSLVTKLSPAKVVGFMMGFWFLSSSIAHQAGKWISKFTAVDGADATAEETLKLSLSVFNQVGFFAIGSAVVLLVLSPILTKWMHGVK